MAPGGGAAGAPAERSSLVRRSSARVSWVSPRQLVVLLFAAAMLLPGCFGGGGKKGASADQDEHEGESGNATVLAVIEVEENGTTLGPINGSIPAKVGVNLTFDASGSQGSNLTYTWKFGDAGEGTNVTETRAFSKVGLYNVSLTVIGRSAYDDASVLVNVSTAGPPAGTVVHTQHESFTGALTLGNPNTPTTAGTDFRDHVITIAATTPNGTAMARVARLALDGSGASAISTTLYWRDPAGTSLATAGGQFPPTGQTLDQSITFEGDMAPGDYTVRVRLNAGSNYSYTVTADVDYVT